MRRSNFVTEAEALFGSAARHDHDAASDIDYLIVDSDYDRLRLRKRWLTARGYSVSDYTWVRLERLIEQGALFAIHLKLEARILHDTSSSRLNSLLLSARAKESYLSDFNSSLLLFAPLASTHLSQESVAWACDVAATAFRNAAILQLASEGTYAFGNEDILAALAKRGRATSSTSTTFRKLRQAKHAYRTGRTIASIEFLQESLREIERTLGEPIRDLTHSRPLYTRTPSTDAYGLTRSIERDLISLEVPIGMINEKQQLLNLIRNPHAYLWHFIRYRPQMEFRVDRLRNLGWKAGSSFLSAA